HRRRPYRDDWPRCGGCPARLAVVVRHRSRHARRRSALSARGWTALRPVRAGHGPLLRVARCRAAALATAGEPDAVGDRGGLAVRWSGDLSHVFLALGVALAAFGL